MASGRILDARIDFSGRGVVSDTSRAAVVALIDRQAQQGAQPGIAMFADPAAHAGEPYRQEYFPGEAEDMGRVVGAAGPLTVPFGSFEDVVQTEDWTPLEPDVREHKYYARGVGVIKEVNLATGEAVELVSLLMP